MRIFVKVIYKTTIKMTHLKSIATFLGIISFALIVSSCNQEKSKDSKEVAEEHNDAKFEDNQAERDAQFLVNAAEISLQEVSLGILAQQKGSTSIVKDLGKMMENDHTTALAKLNDLAQTKSITLPSSQTKNSQDNYQKLMSKSGKEFDKEYADMMVKGHKEAIEKFEKASKETTYPSIAAWATETLPILRTHLDHSMTCKSSVDEMK